MAPAVFEDRQLAYVQKALENPVCVLWGFWNQWMGVTPYRLEMQAKVGIGDAKICMITGERLYRSVIDDSRVIINRIKKNTQNA